MIAKFLLILILIIYLFYKGTGLLFKSFFGSYKDNLNRETGRRNETSRKVPNSNLNIDDVPSQRRQRRNDRGNSFDGGDYVDFEEVK